MYEHPLNLTGRRVGLRYDVRGRAAEMLFKKDGISSLDIHLVFFVGEKMCKLYYSEVITIFVITS